jgi:signal peptidase II
MALVWSCVAAVAIVLFYLLLPGGPTSVTRIGLALVAAGAVGNVLDRLRFGAVVDFIDVGIRSVRWPVFNVADSAVTVGVAVLLLHGLLRRPGVETPAPPS